MRRTPWRLVGILALVLGASACTTSSNESTTPADSTTSIDASSSISSTPLDASSSTSTAPSGDGAERIERVVQRDGTVEQERWFLTVGSGVLPSGSVELIRAGTHAELRMACTRIAHLRMDGDLARVTGEPSRRRVEPSCSPWEQRVFVNLADRLVGELNVEQTSDGGLRLHNSAIELRFTAEEVSPWIEPDVILPPGSWRTLGTGRQRAWSQKLTGVATTTEQLEDLMFTVEFEAGDELDALDFDTEVAVLFTDPRFRDCEGEDPIAALGLDPELSRLFSVPSTEPSCTNGDKRSLAIFVAVDRAALPPAPFVLQLGPYEPQPGFPGERRTVAMDLRQPGTTLDPDLQGFAPSARMEQLPERLQRGPEQPWTWQAVQRQLDYIRLNRQWWQSTQWDIVSNPPPSWFDDTDRPKLEASISPDGDEIVATLNAVAARWVPFVAGDVPQPDQPKPVDAPADHVVMATSPSSAGWTRTEVVAQMLRAAGYDVHVSAPVDHFDPFGEIVEYRTVDTAIGEIDLFVGPASDDRRARPSNQVVVPNSISGSGAPQGWLVTKAWADSAGFTTIDEINRDPELYGALPQMDGRGVVWACPTEVSSAQRRRDAESGLRPWQNLTPVRNPYDVNWAEFMDKVDAGEPAIMYVSAPSPYYLDARVGEKTMWLSVEEQVADQDQPDFLIPVTASTQCIWNGVFGFGDLEPEVCLPGPDGCELGWLPNVIRATANKDWLETHPRAKALLGLMAFSPEELSELEYSQNEEGSTWPSDGAKNAADEWMTENVELLAGWLDEVATLPLSLPSG